MILSIENQEIWETTYCKLTKYEEDKHVTDTSIVKLQQDAEIHDNHIQSSLDKLKDIEDDMKLKADKSEVSMGLT